MLFFVVDLILDLFRQSVSLVKSYMYNLSGRFPRCIKFPTLYSGD